MSQAKQIAELINQARKAEYQWLGQQLPYPAMAYSSG